MNEIVVYRSPYEKIMAEWLIQHPFIMAAISGCFGLFFLFVITNIIIIWYKVLIGHRRGR